MTERGGGRPSALLLNTVSHHLTATMAAAAAPMAGKVCVVTGAASGIGEASHHLLLLAQNQQGYQNLLKLSSIAYNEGFYYRPRIDREVLEQFHEGLIVTSACMSGEISNAIIRDNVIKARETAEWYQQLLGERSVLASKVSIMHETRQSSAFARGGTQLAACKTH